MTVTFRDVVRAPEQPFAESFIYNAIRKTFDQGQLELVKSGNRQPVSVTTRYYSARHARSSSFTDTKEDPAHRLPRRQGLLALRRSRRRRTGLVARPPRRPVSERLTPAELKISAWTALVKEGLIALSEDKEFATAAPGLLMAKAVEYHESELARRRSPSLSPPSTKTCAAATPICSEFVPLRSNFSEGYESD